MKKSQLHGKRVTCKIEGTEIKDAKLSIKDGEIFICQNIKNGWDCKEKFGYKYSWVIGFFTRLTKKKLSDLEYSDVTDLKFVETRGRKKKESPLVSRLTGKKVKGKYDIDWDEKNLKKVTEEDIKKAGEWLTKKEKKVISVSFRQGKSSLVSNGFLAACDANETAIYEDPQYVCFSKKELERREKQQMALTAPSLDLTQDNKEQVILILLEEGYKVWEKEGLLYFEKIMV